MKVWLTSLLLFALTPAASHAYPNPPDCDTTLLSAGNTTADLQKKAARTYVYGNALFPQMSSGILGSLVTFYFTHPLSSQEIEDTLLDAKALQNLRTAMDAAHGAHGVKPVSFERLENNASFMLIRFSTVLRQALVFFIPESKSAKDYRFAELESQIFSNTVINLAFNRMKSYAPTIQAALHSKEARDLSKEYLDSLEDVAHLPLEQREDVIFEYSQRLKLLVVDALKRAHPELAEQIANPRFPNSPIRPSVAESLWDAVSRTRMPFGI